MPHTDICHMLTHDTYLYWHKPHTHTCHTYWHMPLTDIYHMLTHDTYLYWQKPHTDTCHTLTHFTHILTHRLNTLHLLLLTHVTWHWHMTPLTSLYDNLCFLAMFTLWQNAHHGSVCGICHISWVYTYLSRRWCNRCHFRY